jgi:hypothetical protein
MARASDHDDRHNDVRVSAFDVLIQHNGRFLAIFYGCWIALTGLLSYARIVTAESPPLMWAEVAIIVIVAAAICVGISIPLAFGLSEGTPMVLAKIIKDRYREEGRQERDRIWEAWNERRLAADRDGRPFTEPPPSHHGTPSEDAS